MTQEWVAPVFPDDYPRGQRLRPLLNSGICDVKRGVEARRDATRRDPLLFALLYLGRNLRDEATGIISFSQFHLDAYDRIARWAGPDPDRSAWVSHREAGKSVVWFLVAPLWAAAHGHRRFFLALSCTGDQAKMHLGNLKTPIEQGGLLLHDFPHLRPARPWTVTNAVTVGGQRFFAAGLEKTILGIRHHEQRPDLIVGDDLDLGEADFTPASKAKTLGRLEHDVLPAASQHAAVVLTGTPTASGSLMHDVVRAVRGRPGALEDRGEWIAAHGFDPHWYPAIVNEGTPQERSAWPTRWPLAVLRERRAAAPRVFALQRQCDPDDPAAWRWWVEEIFRHDPRFVSDRRILSIDGAVTSKRADADPTAVSLVAVAPGGHKVCVEYAAAGSWSRPELRAWVVQAIKRFPRSLRTVLVETNQGGEMWREALEPLPSGVELVPYYVQGTKRHRIESLYDEYARGAVWHTRHLAALEAQMTAWKPARGGHGVDDLIDATAAAVRYALYGDASRAPAPRDRAPVLL